MQKDLERWMQWIPCGADRNEPSFERGCYAETYMLLSSLALGNMIPEHTAARNWGRPFFFEVVFWHETFSLFAIHNKQNTKPLHCVLILT